MGRLPLTLLVVLVLLGAAGASPFLPCEDHLGSCERGDELREPVITRLLPPSVGAGAAAGVAGDGPPAKPASSPQTSLSGVRGNGPQAQAPTRLEGQTPPPTVNSPPSQNSGGPPPSEVSTANKQSAESSSSKLRVDTTPKKAASITEDPQAVPSQTGGASRIKREIAPGATAQAVADSPSKRGKSSEEVQLRQYVASPNNNHQQIPVTSPNKSRQQVSTLENQPKQDRKSPNSLSADQKDLAKLPSATVAKSDQHSLPKRSVRTEIVPRMQANVPTIKQSEADTTGAQRLSQESISIEQVIRGDKKAVASETSGDLPLAMKSSAGNAASKPAVTGVPNTVGKSQFIPTESKQAAKRFRDEMEESHVRKTEETNPGKNSDAQPTEDNKAQFPKTSGGSKREKKEISKNEASVKQNTISESGYKEKTREPNLSSPNVQYNNPKLLNNKIVASMIRNVSKIDLNIRNDSHHFKANSADQQETVRTKRDVEVEDIYYDGTISVTSDSVYEHSHENPFNDSLGNETHSKVTITKEHLHHETKARAGPTTVIVDGKLFKTNGKKTWKLTPTHNTNKIVQNIKPSEKIEGGFENQQNVSKPKGEGAQLDSLHDHKLSIINLENGTLKVDQENGKNESNKITLQVSYDGSEDELLGASNRSVLEIYFESKESQKGINRETETVSHESNITSDIYSENHVSIVSADTQYRKKRDTSYIGKLEKGTDKKVEETLTVTNLSRQDSGAENITEPQEEIQSNFKEPLTVQKVVEISDEISKMKTDISEVLTNATENISEKAAKSQQCDDSSAEGKYVLESNEKFVPPAANTSLSEESISIGPANENERESGPFAQRYVSVQEENAIGPVNRDKQESGSSSQPFVSSQERSGSFPELVLAEKMATPQNKDTYIEDDIINDGNKTEVYKENNHTEESGTTIATVTNTNEIYSASIHPPENDSVPQSSSDAVEVLPVAIAERMVMPESIVDASSHQPHTDSDATGAPPVVLAERLVMEESGADPSTHPPEFHSDDTEAVPLALAERMVMPMSGVDAEAILLADRLRQRDGGRRDVEEDPPEEPQLRFPSVPPGEDFHAAKLGLSEGVFLFSYLSTFISWLQPQEFPVELVRDVLWNRVSVTDLITEALQVEVGFISVLSVGLALSLAVPLTALGFACCRLLESRGDNSRDREPTACRRRSLLCGLWTVLLLMAVGVASMFASNEQVSAAVQWSPRVLHTALSDTSAFVRSTQHQIGFVASKSLDQALAAAIEDLDGADALLGAPIQRELSRETGVDVALDALSDVSAAAEDASQRAAAALEQAAQTRGLALVARERLQDLRYQLDAARRQCAARDRPLCDTVDAAGLDVSIRLETLLSDDRLVALRDLRDGNLSAAAQQARADFQLLPRQVAESTRDARLGIRRELVRERAQLQDALSPLDSFARTVSARVDGARSAAQAAATVVTEADYWRWLAGLGAAMAMLLVWLLLAVGGGCGCCGSQEKARPVLITGVVTASVLSLLLWAVTLLAFTLGAHGEVLACRPLYSAPDYPQLSRLLDRPGVLFQGGGFFRNVAGNASLDVPLKDVIQECELGRPAYQALQLRQLFDSDHATGRGGQWEGVRQQVQRLRVDLGELRVLTPGLQAPLQETLRAAAANLTQHRLALAGPVTARDLQALADQLVSVSSQVTDLSSASRLETLAARARRLLASHVTPLEQRKEDLVYRLTALEVALGPLQRQANQSLSHLKTIQYFVTQQGESIARAAVRRYSDRLLGYLRQAREHVLQQVNRQVAPCRPLFDVFHAARQLLCRHAIDPLNGLWFSSAWCLLLLVAAAPLGLHLADAYRRRDASASLLGSRSSEWQVEKSSKDLY